MGLEIERKFLVVAEDWRKCQRSYAIKQGYLSSESAATVRVRVQAKDAYLTIKGPTKGIKRSEFEYPIPLEDAEEILNSLCDGAFIEKQRFEILENNKLWVVDEFFGDNAGLIVAEIELESECERFTKPSWLGREVSDDPRYFNSQLLQEPFKNWKV